MTVGTAVIIFVLLCIIVSLLYVCYRLYVAWRDDETILNAIREINDKEMARQGITLDNLITELEKTNDTV